MAEATAISPEYRARLDDFYRQLFGPFGCTCDWPEGKDRRLLTLGPVAGRSANRCPDTCTKDCKHRRAPHPDAGVESRTPPPGPPAGVRLLNEG